MKRNLTISLLSCAVLAAALSPLGAQTTVIGPGVNNGDFNADTTGTDSSTFADTPSWQNLSADQDQQATRTNVNYDGTRNAVLTQAGTRVFGNDTGYTIAAGDVFDLSYVWRDASGWEAADEVRFTLFTTPDDDITNPTRTVLVNADSGGRATAVTYEEVVQPAVFSATGAEAGRTLFLVFDALDNSGDSQGFARLDNVLLTVTSGTPIDPILSVVSGDYVFGDLWHPSGTDTTVRIVTFRNDGVAENLTIDAISLRPGTDSVFSITDAPNALDVIAPGGTFTVEITVTGGGGIADDTGELLVDVSHASSPANDQDQALPLSATISTTGDAYSLITNGSLDDGLTGWTGGSASVAGMVSGNGARVRGVGDNRADLAAVFADSLSQVFGFQTSPDFALSCSIAIPDFTTWTGWAADPAFYDRSFHLAVLADSNTPGVGEFASGQNASTLINLFYFPAGTDDGGGATPAGFYLYDGTAGSFVHLSALGTMTASIDADEDGALTTGGADTLNVYELTIAGTGFGTGSASYVISLTDPGMATVSTASLTTSHGTSITAATAKAVVFTTSDSETDSVTNPAATAALQTSFWVDEISASITPTLPLALLTVVDPAPSLQVYPKSRQTFTFSIRNDGFQENLTLDNPVFSDPRLTLVAPVTLPVTVAPGDSFEFEIELDSRNNAVVSDLSATLTFDTNDAIQATQVFTINARLLANGQQVLIDYDDGNPGNGVHDMAVRSGGFEENVVGQTFAEADFWTARFPEGLDTQLVYDSDPATGTLHAETSGWVANGVDVRAQAAQLIPGDEWTLAEGDYFTLEVTWKDGVNFDTATPGQLQIVMEVLTPDGSGTVNDPENGENNANRLLTRFDPLITAGMFQTYSVTTPAVQPGSPWIGNLVLVRFFVSGGTNDRGSFALIDNVSMVAHLDTAPLVVTDWTHNPATGAATIRWKDTGRVYKIQSSGDLTFGAGTVEFPVDGTADYTSYPGEIEFAFSDAAGVAPGPRFWRVVAE